MVSIKSRAIALFMVIMTLVCSMMTVGFATDGTDNNGEGGDTTTNYEDYIASHIIYNSAGITFTDSMLKNYLTDDDSKSESGQPFMTITTTSGEQKPIYLIKGKSEEELFKKVGNSIKNQQTVSDVSNITDSLNIGADTAGATAMLSGFAPIISLVVGIIVVLVTMGMTLFSAFDIAYIAFPVFRNKCEDAKMQGQGAMVKKGGNGEASLRFVTDDAQYAVSQGTIESGKSPWGIYFRKRVMSYILLAIILFILLTGNISLITNIALKVVSGIMNVLGGLA